MPPAAVLLPMLCCGISVASGAVALEMLLPRKLSFTLLALEAVLADVLLAWPMLTPCALLLRLSEPAATELAASRLRSSCFNRKRSASFSSCLSGASDA